MVSLHTTKLAHCYNPALHITTHSFQYQQVRLGLFTDIPPCFVVPPRCLFFFDTSARRRRVQEMVNYFHGGPFFYCVKKKLGKRSLGKNVCVHRVVPAGCGTSATERRSAGGSPRVFCCAQRRQLQPGSHRLRQRGSFTNTTVTNS